MLILKYCIDDTGFPILFKTKIIHSDVLTSAVSAGYAIISYDVSVQKFSVKCYGGSESLNIFSSKKDCLIIEGYLNSSLSNFGTRTLPSNCKLDSLVVGKVFDK